MAPTGRLERMRRALALASGLLIAAGLAACGEKDEPEPSAPTAGDDEGGALTTTTTTTGTGGGGQGGSPEAEVEASVIAVLGSIDVAAACSELVTTRYVRTAYGDERGCRAAVAQRQKVAIAVGNSIKIQGNTATAKAVPDGGPNKGETIKVELVKEGGTWKVDSAVSNAPAGP
jgi:hypothetical protein